MSEVIPRNQLWSPHFRGCRLRLVSVLLAPNLRSCAPVFSSTTWAEVSFPPLMRIIFLRWFPHCPVSLAEQGMLYRQIRGGQSQAPIMRRTQAPSQENPGSTHPRTTQISGFEDAWTGGRAWRIQSSQKAENVHQTLKHAYTFRKHSQCDSGSTPGHSACPGCICPACSPCAALQQLLTS